MYDIDLIFSWTPREFKNFIKGAQLRRVDEYEQTAISAFFAAQVENAKRRLKLKDVYDADKMRKEIETGGKRQAPVLNMERYRNAQRALKKLGTMSLGKGG